MAWPSSPGFDKTLLNDNADDPAVGRGELYDALVDIEAIIAGRNQANGVCPLDSDSLVPLANLPITPIVKSVFVDHVPGAGKTWEVPAGVTRLMIEQYGAGAGGAFSSTDPHGGGGGAGSGIWQIYNVTPGQFVNYDIGVGGAGATGPSSAPGADGGDTTVTVGGDSFTSRGGQGGQSNGTGGQGGVPDPGAVAMYGGRGNDGQTDRGGNGGQNMRGGNSGSRTFGGGGSGSGEAGGPAQDGGPGGIIVWW